MVEVCRTNASQEHHKRGTRRVVWNALGSEPGLFYNGELNIVANATAPGGARDAHKHLRLSIIPRQMDRHTEQTPKSSKEKLHFSLVYGLESVIPIRNNIGKTKRVQDFGSQENEKRRREDMDILEEMRK
ncbi:hypothetical protein Tco_0718020 [Tanacetum coccineum]